MNHGGRGLRRWSSVTRVLAMTASLGLLGVVVAPHPAGANAGNAGDPDYEQFVHSGNHFSYQIEARGYGPYAKIPYPAYNGSPYGRAELASVPGRCFSFGSQYYGDEYGEEFLFEGGQKSVTNPGEARAEYPETVRNPKHVELAPFGANGPRSVADCPSIRESDGYATYSYNGDTVNHVGFATSHSHAVLDLASSAITGESQANLEDVLLGGQLSIKRVETYMKVTQLANQEPTVDYRIVLFGITAGGTPMAGCGEKGVVFAGQKVAGADLDKQFAAQVNKNSEALKSLAAWHINVMAPQFKYDNVEYDIRAPVFSAAQRPAGQDGDRGEEQGFILGEVHYKGAFNHTGK
jgi:hypothetical protein